MIFNLMIAAEGGAELQEKTVSPAERQMTVEPDDGYDGLSRVNVNAISGSYVGSGVARRDSTDLTASGAVVTAPAGYYASPASKAVPAGTAGTPTAIKGAVSNHAVTVTPSVTNTAGYIEGGTKTGTGVSVAAGELVSGTKSITENGTHDVTNYAGVNVNVSGYEDGDNMAYGSQPAPVSDLTGTSWQLNNLLNINSYDGYDITFASPFQTGTTFINFSFDQDRDRIIYFSSNWSWDVYENGNWNDDDAKTISISGGSDANNSTFITWLLANAVRIS